MQRTKRNRRHLLVIGGMAVLVAVGLATVAIAQSGSSISLNSPVSFPVDI